MISSDLISTARGPIPATELGFTLMHEHLAIFSPGMPQTFPHLYDRGAIIEAVRDSLRDARAVGVTTIVDVTTLDLGRDVALIAEAAQGADVHVVVSTGIWLDVPRFIRGRGPDEAAELFAREIATGIQGTPIRAGIIKVASDATVTPAEEIVLRGAARASLATGVPIATHSMPRPSSGLRQVEILSEEGVPLERVIIGHSTTTDRTYLERLYATGCTVGWDTFAYTEPDSNSVLETLADFARRHSDRTVLSNDSSPYADWEPWTAPSNYRAVTDVVIPRLREAGVTAEQINQITVGNPARLLAGSVS